MTHEKPSSPSTGRARVELKVWASTAVAFIASCVVAVAEAVQDNPAILEGLPWWARFLVLAVIPPVIVFGAGYAAPHTPRPEVDQAG